MLVYTRQDLSIQGGQQSCWCKLVLYYSGHVDIVNHEHLLCLTYIFYWWRHCMLIYCQEDTNFHQYWLLIHQPGWYLPHTLCWNCVCYTRTLLGIYLLLVPSARLLVMRSGRTLFKDMGDCPIPRWRWPSWDCMIHTQRSPVFLFSSSITGLVPRFSLRHISEWFCILFALCMCRAFTVYHLATLFYTINAGDVIKVFPGDLFILFCLTFIIPSFTTMCKHNLVADTLRFGLSIRVIFRLVI